MSWLLTASQQSTWAERTKKKTGKVTERSSCRPLDVEEIWPGTGQRWCCDGPCGSSRRAPLLVGRDRRFSASTTRRWVHSFSSSSSRIRRTNGAGRLCYERERWLHTHNLRLAIYGALEVRRTFPWNEKERKKERKRWREVIGKRKRSIHITTTTTKKRLRCVTPWTRFNIPICYYYYYSFECFSFPAKKRRQGCLSLYI